MAHYLYDPYGNILSQSGPLADANLYRFSSKEFHVASGLVYYLYRFYEPSLQRWLNRDPLGDYANVRFALAGYRLVGRQPYPFELWGDVNLYAFVGNDPIDATDPLGLWRWPDFINVNLNITIPTPWTGTLIGWSGTVSIDRFGHWYWSPLGLGVGKSLTVVSGSLTANWLDVCHKPTPQGLTGFLTQSGFNGSVGYWGGVSQSYTPGSGGATGVGFVSPQLGVSYNYSFQGAGNTGLRW